PYTLSLSRLHIAHTSLSSLTPRPFFFFFKTPPPPEFSPLSLHDALPICWRRRRRTTGTTTGRSRARPRPRRAGGSAGARACRSRSEEHTSELQSLTNLVCRLLLEKKTRRHIKQAPGQSHDNTSLTTAHPH